MVEIDTIKLLRDVGWATSNSEAKRMIQGGGVYIDGEKHDILGSFFFAGCEFIMKHGRKFVRVRIPEMEQFYDA